ncbi:MAG: PfkB family carbohydrate kinase [Candidatus Adiutrix sp.]|jgi:pyridoxine kinase|nr:PfkB family carbohydrate kinase [Candidatus Adiutrix sp.]
MNNRVLLISDLPGYGKVALSAMFPILSKAGLNLFNLPTALVSNTLDYGKFEILDTTAYMKNSLAVWDELGFEFDAICVGFIVSEAQTRLVLDFAKKQREKGVWIFVDPIMGDDGKLYNGISPQHVGYMRELCSIADLAVPNLTEATLLAGLDPETFDMGSDEADRLLRSITELGAKSVVITSARVEGQDMVLGYDGQEKTRFEVPFDYVPVRFPGTGDIFSALVISRALAGARLEEAARFAARVVRELIVVNRDNADKYAGIPIEKFLELIYLEKTEN